jgi:hypothetical protein
MRQIKRAIGVSVLIGAITMTGLVAPPMVGTGLARPARWHLEDYHQSSCFSAVSTVSYYGVYIDGTWRRSIDVGAANLPPGGSYTTSYAPIPPGSSNGDYSLAYVAVELPSNEPLGTYTASLWASTGRIRQSVPIELVVQDRCGY